MKKMEQKLKKINYLFMSDLLSFSNNKEEILRAYSNGSLRAIVSSPLLCDYYIDTTPDIEIIIKNDCVGFYIVN